MKGILAAEIMEPYAQALMSAAQSGNLVEQVAQDVNFLLELLNSAEDLKNFLANPVIKTEAKKSVLQQVTGDQIHPYTRSFLMILVDRRRILFLEGVCKQFQALLRQLNQTVLAEVTSAVALSEAQQQTVRERVTAMVNARQVDLDLKVDPDLIGGVIIKVGSQVIDASLRTQLRRISLRLTSAT
ncbi:F0F1 ATP synthase subunit delta [Leptolyngbya sp. 'hensonii']|uniref:ATP synthase F1 subunit delta n=1 Tax=Leptolyngbya sp. 'hensonii' TaxID=1922337 RepID=UPI00094FBB48|nr:ATP synthase F1 subunit delta [Leptolyngbya sp. 'hensonii']OLP15367.1 F0F1 ATP synthase subunit delta [Leptolyngbya sp. 'hensonii']